MEKMELTEKKEMLGCGDQSVPLGNEDFQAPEEDQEMFVNNTVCFNINIFVENNMINFLFFVVFVIFKLKGWKRWVPRFSRNKSLESKRIHTR